VLPALAFPEPAQETVAARKLNRGGSVNAVKIQRGKSEAAIMAVENGAESMLRETIDQGRETAEKAARAVKDGYDAAQQYVREKGFNLDLGELVRREPWLALAAAFAIGYVAAQIIRRAA
jgi:ElaB/YqjD/DUF883 family membrane-anchored ribosome-binding protein